MYTVVVGGFLTSALSGSAVTVGGPTAAFIPIVAGVAHQYGAGGLVVCTGMAGAMLVAMGASGLGGVIRCGQGVPTGFGITCACMMWQASFASLDVYWGRRASAASSGAAGGTNPQWQPYMSVDASAIVHFM